jgi:hypothetical protein
VYIRGEDNTVADALSRLPVNTFADEIELSQKPDLHQTWAKYNAVGAVLTISTDPAVLAEIKAGYQEDEFCKKLATTFPTVPGISQSNDLWYAGSRLIIPRVGNLRENLFRLAHDCLGHFGTDKSYAALRDAYYWPNMRRDLEQAYVPGCHECQRNKSRTTKPTGPLHPLPVPDAVGESVAVDFIGPLPNDNGFDCILTMTDRLNADIRIIPTRTTITAEEFAALFFEHWYCENGLPADIVSDRDKLFVSKFWRALCKLTGIRARMSTAYHPETDGSSERSNKTINQSLRYYVERNQKGWVKALPIIRFNMMNTENASTGFSPFQLRLGRSPRIIPPIIDTNPASDDFREVEAAKAMMERIKAVVDEAKDNMLIAKIAQAHAANKHRGKDDVFAIGDKVMLCTFNRRREYKKKHEKRSAKFFPRFDGPYRVVCAHPTFSAYEIDIPNSRIFPVFHASHLRRFIANDPTLFPSREYARPGPIVTEDGVEEYGVERIIDSRRRGRGWSYLVRWEGYGPEEDTWLPGSELADCEALDRWIGEDWSER